MELKEILQHAKQVAEGCDSGCDCAYQHDELAACLEELAEYRKLGSLSELKKWVPPIRTGETVYFVIDGKVFCAPVSFLYCQKHQTFGIYSEIRGSCGSYSCISASFADWGKTVFPTMAALRSVFPDL